MPVRILRSRSTRAAARSAAPDSPHLPEAVEAPGGSLARAVPTPNVLRRPRFARVRRVARRRWRGLVCATVTSGLAAAATRELIAAQGALHAGRVARGDDHATSRVGVRRAATTPASLLSGVGGVDGETAIARGRCVAIAIAPDVAAECGDLRLTHALPAVAVRGKVRAPVLTYNSNHGHPMTGVRATVTLPTGSVATNVSFALAVRLGGAWVDATYAARTIAGSKFPAGAARRVTLPLADLWTVASGVYDVRVTVRAALTTGDTLTDERVGRAAAVNRRASPFGAGWWLAGQEQLLPIRQGVAALAPTADSLFWVGGDGSARVYAHVATDGGTGRRTYLAAALTRPDTLTWEPALGRWARHLPNAAAVRFDSLGRHRETVTRLGDVATFEYTGTATAPTTIRPASVVAPTLAYTFHYAATTGRLDSVVAPGVAGARVTRATVAPDVYNDVGQLTRLIEPSGDSVRFGYDPENYHYVQTRTDRRGSVREFRRTSWNRLGATWAFTAPAGTTPRDSVGLGFVPGEQAGLDGTASPHPVAPDSVVTRFDGPRTAASTSDGRDDITTFWLDTLGRVRKVVSAAGDSAVVTYGDARFPGLATRTRDPLGFTTEAFYNARGLADSTRAINPFGPGAGGATVYATSRYTWDATWDAATKIVNPEGVTTWLGYDAATGNRLWQQVGPRDGPGVTATSDTSRRVRFTYNATGSAANAGLLASVLQPAVGTDRAPQAVSYDALGNGAAVAGPGPARVESLRDAIGRVVRTRTRIDSAAGLWQVDSTAYDAAGRVSYSSSWGPAMAGADSQRVVVRKWYTKEGGDSVVTRESVPDPASIGTMRTEWRYDALGRVIVEIAPDATPGTLSDNPVDSTLYDVAGNVVRRRNRRGESVTMAYDALGRLTSRTIPATQLSTQNTVGDGQTFSFDAAGRLRTADNADARVARTYYPGGALAAETLRVRTVFGSDFNTHRYVTGYAYDRAGRRTTLTYPTQLSPLGTATGGTAATATYAYDSTTGALATVTDVQGNVYRIAETVRGALDSLALPGGIVERFAYGGDGALRADTLFNRTPTSVPRRHTAALLRAAGFEYDQRGKLTAMRNAAGLKDTLTAAYDGLGLTVKTRYVAVQTDSSPPFPIGSKDSLRLDALGNLIANTTTDQGRVRTDVYSAGPVTALSRYQAGTGRLRGRYNGTDMDTLVYDAAGNVERQKTLTWEIGVPEHPLGAPREARSMSYGADGLLRAASWGVSVYIGEPTVLGEDPYASRSVGEDYRYDALGRRVLMTSNPSCKDVAMLPGGTQRQEAPCRQRLVRRTVWDGVQEIGEIQMPGSIFQSDTLQEHDVGPIGPVAQFPVDSAYGDADRLFGRVAYTHALGIDRPLAVTRMDYVDAPQVGSEWSGTQKAAARFGAFTVVPLWDAQGEPELAALADGSKTTCMTVGSEQRCALFTWADGWFPYERAKYAGTSWHGTLLDAKRDGTGLLYRRARYYDPTTGRFTQEDPIGLAGGTNQYAYAAGDPVNLRDPLGLKPCPESEWWCVTASRTEQKDGRNAAGQAYENLLRALGMGVGSWVGGGLGGMLGGGGGTLAAPGPGTVAGAVGGAHVGAAIGAAVGLGIAEGVIWLNKGESRDIAAALKDELGRPPTKDERIQMGEYIHEVKQELLMRPSDTFGYHRLRELVRELFGLP